MLFKAIRNALKTSYNGNIPYKIDLYAFTQRKRFWRFGEDG